MLYDGIYLKRIDSFKGLPDLDNKKWETIRAEIEDAFAKGKINDQHYSLLNKKIDSFMKESNAGMRSER